MKKIVSIFTVMCIILAVFVPFVSASDEVKITSVTYTSGGNIYTLKIHGLSTAYNNVSLVIKNRNGDFKAMDQCKAVEDGTFSKEVKVNITSDKADDTTPVVYTVIARNYTNKAFQYTVTLYTEDAKQSIVDTYFKPAALNNSVTDMGSAITEYSTVFGFNMEYYSAMSEEIAQNMIDMYKKEAYTASNINESYEVSVIRAYLFDAEASADRTAVIEDSFYTDILGFENGFEGSNSLYPEYAAMTEDDKESINLNVFVDENKFIDFDSLKEKFFMAITAQTIKSNSEDYQAIYDFLTEHNDWFELKEIEELSKSQVSRIIGGLKDETIPDNKNAFVELYEKHYDSVTGSNTGISKPATGGTGGGGGGGGGTGNIISGVGEAGFEPAPETAVPETAPVTEAAFKDLDGYMWAQEAITYLAGKNIVNGRSEGEFVPEGNVTREEFAKILVLTYGMYDEDAECEFSDVSAERWSYKYVASLYNNGIVTGYGDGSFGVSNLITREEMAVMMCRILVRQSKIDADYGTYTAFNDFNEISEFAVNSVLMLGYNGILSGDDSGNFNPKNSASRAEACQMIYNSVIREGGIN